MEKTIESAKQWIENGKPCIYRYGFSWKGASSRPISKEKALEILPKYSFNKGFYILNFTKEDNQDVLEFKELSQNDMW